MSLFKYCNKCDQRVRSDTNAHGGINLNLKTFKNNLCNHPQIFNSIRSFLLGGQKKTHEELKTLIRLTKINNVLDVGCGTGEFSELFDNSISYTGIDAQKEFIEYAVDNHIGNSKSFLVMDINKAKFKKNEFDVVMLLSFTHHFSNSELRPIIDKIKKITKRIIILDPIPRANILSEIFYSLDRGDYIRSRNDLLNLLECDLCIEKYKEFNSGLYTYALIECSQKMT